MCVYICGHRHLYQKMYTKGNLSRNTQKRIDRLTVGSYAL